MLFGFHETKDKTPNMRNDELGVFKLACSPSISGPMCLMNIVLGHNKEGSCKWLSR